MPAFPEALADLATYYQHVFGVEEFERIVLGLCRPRTPSFRANLCRGTLEALLAELTEKSCPFTAHPLSPWSFTTTPEGERAIRETPAYKTGRLYLQSLPSQAGALALNVQPGMRVLDATAAPGGKTSLLAMLVGKGGHVVAVERSTVRAGILHHNLKKLGCDNTTVVTADVRSLPQRVLRQRFDAVIVDAPCSGTGTMNPQDPRTWQHLADRATGYIDIKAHQQASIVRAVLPLLNPGGHLVYSTCSIDPRENELVIDALLRDHPELQVKIPSISQAFPQAKPALTAIAGTSLHPDLSKTLRLHPDTWGEGFFIARLQKEEVVASLRL